MSGAEDSTKYSWMRQSRWVVSSTAVPVAGPVPVASAAGGPARLLHVLLDGGRHLEMHDQLDVRLVDAESEGFSGDYDVDLAVTKGVLGVLALPQFHGPAVGADAVAEAAQQCG